MPLLLLHVATSSFCPTGNMTKKVKLLPNTHTHILTSRKGSAFPFLFALSLPLPVICKCDNASYSHTAFSVPVRLVSSFKTPPKNDQRDQNWTNSCYCCCFSFFLLLLLLEYVNRKMGTGWMRHVGGPVGLVQFQLAAVGPWHFRATAAACPVSTSEYLQSQCQCQSQSQSPFTFTLTSTSPFVSLLIASVHLLGKV